MDSRLVLVIDRIVNLKKEDTMQKILAGTLIVVATLFTFSTPTVIAEGPCTADFDCDLDVDADDVTEFLAQFGREPFYDP